MGLFGKKDKEAVNTETTAENINTEAVTEEVSNEAVENTETTENTENTAADEETTKGKKKKKRRFHIVNSDPDLETSDVIGDTSKEEYKSVEDILAEEVETVIDYFTRVDPIKLNMLERGKMRKEQFEDEVHRFIEKSVTRTPQGDEQHDKVYDSFASFVWKYDILDELIEDPEISDIKIYDWDHIRVKRLGKRESSPVHFRNQKHFLQFVEHTAIKNKVSISDQNAAQNFVDKTSSDKAILRFNISTGFINTNGKYLMHVRKILKDKYTTEYLYKHGFFTPEQAKYIEERIKTGGGFLVCGKGGAGKTNLVNWMVDRIPEDQSGLCIQENEELFSNHPDMAFQHTVQNRGEGKIEYTLGDLARNGLLIDIDYFIIGEIKGAEALYLLNAVYTGAKGWATIHGASSTEAMKKLVDYIKYNSTYSQEEALQMLVHLDTVIFVENFHVAEISEVVRYNPEKKDFDYKRIF